MKIKIAGTDEEIQHYNLVTSELRLHIAFEEFASLVRRLAVNYQFQLIYLTNNDEMTAVGGFRIVEWLAGGKYLEIEDSVVKEGEQSKGYGGKLFDWLAEFAEKKLRPSASGFER